MAYTPNADRQIKNGKAVVSAKELADFREQYGKDQTLRDLLNMEQGKQRKLDIPKSMRNLPDSYESEPDAREAEAGNSRDTNNGGSAYNRPARPPETDTGAKLRDYKANAKAAQDVRSKQISDRENMSFRNKQGMNPISSMMKDQNDSGTGQGSMYKRGGSVKMASGGSASSRADGIAQRGKTKGTMVMCGGGMSKGKR